MTQKSDLMILILLQEGGSMKSIESVTAYSLMNKNEVDATITLEIRSGLVRITNICTLRVPFWIKDVGDFIAHRAAPRGREHIKELLVRSGCNNIKGFFVLQSV